MEIIKRYSYFTNRICNFSKHKMLSIFTDGDIMYTFAETIRSIEQKECNICFEMNNCWMVLGCGHSICSDCSKQMKYKREEAYIQCYENSKFSKDYTFNASLKVCCCPYCRNDTSIVQMKFIDAFTGGEYTFKELSTKLEGIDWYITDIDTLENGGLREEEDEEEEEEEEEDEEEEEEESYLL